MRRGDGITVALTGASGFVGAALLKQLLAQGYAVRALQHRNPLPPHPNLITISGSLGDEAACRTLVSGAQVVLHVGGLVLANRRADFFRVNTQATLTLAHAAVQASVKRFLFVSSLAAREPQLSAYAASKQAAEVQLGTVAGLAYDILRPPAIYGPGDANSATLLNMLRRGRVMLPVRRDARLAMLYVDDLVGAILAWLATVDMPDGSTYELGDHNGGYRWAELLEAASKVLSKPVSLTPLPASVALMVAALAENLGRITGKPSFISIGKIREIMHPDWSADPSAFMQRTGWAPNMTVVQGLALTLDLPKKPAIT